MSSTTESLVVPFLGALQASLAVLLTIAAGVIAAQFNLLSENASKELSRTCVRLFLPALLISNVGSQLHLDSAMRYVPIIIWSLSYNIISILLGILLVHVFHMPDWVTPAIAFNNTTSLPLLLVQSLDASGILARIDSSSDAVDRAKSYFLVNAMIGNSLTFALGPKLLNGLEEDAPNAEKESPGDDDDDDDGETESEEDRLERAQRSNEESSLLHGGTVRFGTRVSHRVYGKGKGYLEMLPEWVQTTLEFAHQFLNAPLIGAVIGAVIGLVPALHRLFFAKMQHGGYLNAWLTSALKNVGELFAALQVVIVGVKLSGAMLKMKKGESSGSVPWLPMVLVTGIRCVAWPAISIPLVYLFATKTNVLGDDPLLWFAMMLMATGPPALKLMALADVNGEDGETKMGIIAKFLTLSYMISPLICFTVVGSLKATQAAANA